MSEHHLDKRGKFNTSCLDPNPACFQSVNEPLIIIGADASGKAVPVMDLVNNEPACEKADFSDTPAMDADSEGLLFRMFDMKTPVNNVFEPTESTGMSADFRKFQFVDPNTLNQIQRQRYETAMRKPPAVLAKPVRKDGIPLTDYTVSEIKDAFPGVSSTNPVTIVDSDESDASV